MAISLSRLKPTEMVRLMNSTDYGTVLSSTQIFRHFDQGGYRISSREDSRCLNFYAYLAWLVDRHNAPPEVPQGYDAARADAARRSAERSLEGRDIGEVATKYRISRNYVSQIRVRIDKRIVDFGKTLVAGA